MLANESITLLNPKIIQKQFEKYIITIIHNMDVINISIEQNNSYKIYESNYTLNYLHTFESLSSKFTINEIIKFICLLIDQNNIKIKENKNNLQFILISNNLVELTLKKKNITSKEIIGKLIKEIECLKEENKKLKESFENLNKRIEIIEKENKETKENRNKNDKINDDNKKNDIQLTNCNLKNINSIKPNDKYINSVSIFPSGNIISVSSDKSIKIFDIHFNILQDIQNAHEDSITYVEIKDEDNFFTCSSDKNIKLWVKNKKEFQIDKIIKNAHEDKIRKLIYCSNENLISCSWDKTIKIWKEKNNNFQNIKTLIHSNEICSILFLEDKNILISSGLEGTKFWDLNNYDDINYFLFFKETSCIWHEGLCRLDEDKIITQDNKTFSLKIISIKNKEIFKEIDYSCQCWGINLIENKGVFLVGGENKCIKIYRKDNYECIQTIKKAHNKVIKGFVELLDGTIASYSNDKTIKIWSF